MDRYVDGFVLPVPTDQLDDYRAIAEEAGQFWMNHGALAYFEGVGDDLEPETGGQEVLSFPELVDPQPDETIIFAFIVYESREHRDDVNAAVMDESTGSPDEIPEMPFDVERMAFGGFRSIVSYEATEE